ncbi:pyridoxal-dependent decarboxylase [Thecamonas trahens ATCC 50062]|uniref:sphinganine-1-phosphate aldolase n=1 Tax=Thecamonas trahens ATCC 50062 TaxID=461836 RepID=A0A0L0DVQ4_THETB|nr:pyridoxal-dependent decarboxylase [Thecamonas trahens ATCC 50062]KNC56399.1 pyridoxal-dependent decarboxylase [Thecamonas trahens ATCC 50062]|eukprot:XP_013760913.1 pyridoxal-dependent decarboxylase [Thecamonas trahens ATCC 50062]
METVASTLSSTLSSSWEALHAHPVAGVACTWLAWALAQPVVVGLQRVLLALFFFRLLRQLVRLATNADARSAALGAVLRSVRGMPGLAGVVAAEQAKTLKEIEAVVLGETSDAMQALPVYTSLPPSGLPLAEIESTMAVLTSEQKMYEGKKAFGGIYHEAGGKVSKATMAAYQAFTYSNALYPMLFPGLRKFEAEVVAMSASMMCGGPEACGTMTSGGTESLIMAIKTYRDMALATRGITAPELVIPLSAHPALNKGAHLLGVKLVVVPLGPDFRADVSAFAAALSSNTIMAVASAPGYPHGVIDPVEEMAAIAADRGIPLHVDTCLGGYLLPFLKAEGRLGPNFDFSVPGVTSMSADLHKYGCAHKGASVILYASPEIRKHQYFQATTWPGGLYCSPSFAGSRPGGTIAAAWAAMVAQGWDGYVAAANEIHDAFEALVDGINAIDGLRVLGEPDAAVIAFDSDDPAVNILQVADEMTARKWDLTRLIKPTCVHWMIGGRQTDLVEPMLADLRESVAEARAHPERASEGMAGIYGMAGTIPDRTVVDELLTGFMDIILKP